VPYVNSAHFSSWKRVNEPWTRYHTAIAEERRLWETIKHAKPGMEGFDAQAWQTWLDAVSRIPRPRASCARHSRKSCLALASRREYVGYFADDFIATIASVNFSLDFARKDETASMSSAEGGGPCRES
jgi:hypothetical protein